MSSEISLGQYLLSFGGRLPYGAAVRLLSPVLREVASLHDAGLSHLGISPETVLVSTAGNKVTLSPAQASGMLSPGFAAPEQYQRAGGSGSWSDVYSLCALIYFALTGKRPQSAIERAALGAGFLDLSDAALDTDTEAVLASGLALSSAQRPQNVHELVRGLGISLNEPASAPIPMPGPVFAPNPAPTPYAAPMPPVYAAPVKAPKPRRKWLLPVAVGVPVMLLLAGAAGFYFYIDGKYNAAVSCIERHDYKTAMSDLTQVIAGYRETTQYLQYATALESLQNNDFATAKMYLDKLGGFLDSRTMLKETDYQQAQFTLKNKLYDDAKKTFTNLGQYKDSADMVSECDYQKAAGLLSGSGYDEAKNLFKSLGNYKDSASMVDECDYQRAKYLLAAKIILAAKEAFTGLAGKNYKDSAQMITECDYQTAMKAFDAQDWLSAYRAFSVLQSYKDSADYAEKAAYGVYNDAIGKYRNGDYTGSQSVFGNIVSYKDSSRYITLCEAHQVRSIDNKSMFNSLSALAAIGFEDAEALRQSDYFIRFRLEGRWKDSNNYYYIELKSSENWIFNYWLPADIGGNKYRIEDCIVYFGVTDNMKPAYKITFISENQLSLYCYGNGKTITLTR